MSSRKRRPSGPTQPETERKARQRLLRLLPAVHRELDRLAARRGLTASGYVSALVMADASGSTWQWRLSVSPKTRRRSSASRTIRARVPGKSSAVWSAPRMAQRRAYRPGVSTRGPIGRGGTNLRLTAQVPRMGGASPPHERQTVASCSRGDVQAPNAADRRGCSRLEGGRSPTAASVDDAGEGNAVNLVESYQRNSMEADERLRAVRAARWTSARAAPMGGP